MGGWSLGWGELWPGGSPPRLTGAPLGLWAKNPPWTWGPPGWCRGWVWTCSHLTCPHFRELFQAPGIGRSPTKPTCVGETPIHPHKLKSGLCSPLCSINIVNTRLSRNAAPPAARVHVWEAWPQVPAHLPAEFPAHRPASLHILALSLPAACLVWPGRQELVGPGPLPNGCRRVRRAGSRPQGLVGQDWAPQRAAGMKPESHR